MAPPGFLQTCAAIGGDVPRDECLAAYRWIGGGVLLSAIILLVVLAIVSGRAVCGKRAPRNPRVLLGAAWLGVVSWGVSGAALLTEGATWLSADASAVVNGVAESGGRQLAVLCLGVAIWLLAARMRPALPLDALSGVVIIGAPVVMLIVAGLAEAEDASSGINAALPPGSAAGCATCRIYDAASLLGAVLYAAGGAVALLRYCASQWANRASDAWLLGADLSGGAAHGLMLLLMLPGYWAAPIFQATACARGCSPFEGLAPGGGTALVIGLLGLASELPLGIGLAGLVAVTAAQLGVCTSGGTRLVVATSASRAGDEYVEGSKAWRARISREHSRERSAVLAHAAASAAPPERVVTSPLEVLDGAVLRGLVLDVDGTLTEPGAICFKEMRRRVGAPTGVDVLTHIASQPHEERATLLAHVVDEEAIGVARARPAPHLGELLAFLHQRRLPRALLTRNNDAVLRETISRVLRPLVPPVDEALDADFLAGADELGDAEVHGTNSAGPFPSDDRAFSFFNLLLSRSFEPPKPHPAALLHVAAQWRLSPTELVMAGDAADDMACARAAGAAAVLVGTAETLGEEYHLAHPLADAVVPDLRGLRQLLHSMLEGAV